MKYTPLRYVLILKIAALALGAGNLLWSADATAQETKFSAGSVNDWLRQESTHATHWDVGGQIRAQYDVKDNAGSFPDSAPDLDFIASGKKNDNAYFLLREKVHLGYKREWFNIFVEARDSSTTGDNRNPNPFADRFDLQQAYLAFGNPKEFPLSLKVGRQQLSYGDERFIETADWSNLERTFDAVKLRYENEHLWIDGFASHYVLPDDGSFNQANWHDLFAGIYASTRTLIPKQETDLYFISRNANTASAGVTASSGTGTTPKDIYTIGARIKSLPGQFHGWNYGAEVAGQLGSFNTGGKRLEHQAWMANFMGGYTWTNAFGSPRLGLDVTYGSGDSNPGDNKHETFDLLYGAAHKFYGLMDVTGLRNTQNPSLNLTIKPLKKLTLRSEYHLFWLADTHDLSYAEVGKGRTLNGYGINPGFSSYFGSEIDLVATYAAASSLNFQAGYGHFFVGDYVKQSVANVPANGGAVDANWFYLMMTVNF